MYEFCCLHIRYLIQLMVLSLLFIQSGCSNVKETLEEALRVLPVQLARMHQTETYTQYFILDNVSSVPTVKKGVSDLTKNEQIDLRMDTIFNNVLGEKNWQHLKDIYGVSEIRDEFINKQILLKGTINFTIYLDPIDHKYFTIEGSGRYYAIRNKDESVLLSGDFQILPVRRSIAELKQGCIALDVDLFVSRIPGNITYYKKTPLWYKIFIDNSNMNKSYSIDYLREHDVYLDLNGDGHSSGQSNELIGKIKLDPSYHRVKIFDLRGIKHVEKDYTIKSKGEVKLSRDKRQSVACK